MSDLGWTKHFDQEEAANSKKGGETEMHVINSTLCLCRECECENIAHTEGANTPHGNPGHKYGARFNQLVDCKTPWGRFQVCSDCAKDCYAEYPSFAFAHEGVIFWRCDKLGAFIGLSPSGREVLEVNMLANGEPETRNGELVVGEVTNLDEDSGVLNRINWTLGTKFEMSHFPGR